MAAPGGHRLAGRLALVTGASRGIGAAVAKRFAAEGAQVILLARTVGALEEIDDEIRAGGSAATLLPLNLRDFDKLDQMAAALRESQAAMLEMPPPVSLQQKRQTLPLKE